MTYGYDANGNQIARDAGDGSSTALAFDVLDRLIEVTRDGVSAGRYSYDYQGLRIEKITAAGSTRYVYDDESVLQRSDAAGITRYEYGPDHLLSVEHPVEGRAYYLHDALGSVVNLVKTDASILGKYRYDAWGNFRSALDPAANPFGFTGHEHDAETGLIYAKARFYDPQIGLFLSQDPVEGQLGHPPSLHKYLYAFQNPTVFVDPDGRIGEIKQVQNFLEGGGTENAAELAGLIQEEFFDPLARSSVPGAPLLARVLNLQTATGLGVIGAASDLLSSAVGVVNTATNLAVFTFASEASEIYQEALAELGETVDTVTYVLENPGEVGSRIVNGVKDTALGVLEGDARSITKATSFVASSVAPGGPLKLLGRARALTSLRSASTLTRGTQSVTRTTAQAHKLRLARAAEAAAKPGRAGAAVRPAKPVPKRVGRKAEAKLCFVAGTLVATEHGLRPIEEIAIGDRVWSRNEETGETRLQEVVELFRTPDQMVYDLELEAEDGTVETLGVTAEHPFRVAGVDWVGAADLEPGDEILTNRDGWLRVRQVRGSPERATVFNFEVAVDHTYFVGETGAWVHNLCEEGKQRVLANIAESRKARVAARVAESRNARRSSNFEEHVALNRKNQSRVELVEGTSAAKTVDAPQSFFPPNNGFLGEPTRNFLHSGERIDRVGGSDFSRFFSPEGTPRAARSLPPETAQQPLRTFEVLKPFEVEVGTIAPAFGQIGLGLQFRTPVPLKILVKRKILREITR